MKMIPIENTEDEFLEFLRKLSNRISKEDVDNVEELIRHQECGVGLEILCSQLFENDVEIKKEELKTLLELSNMLKIDISTYEFRLAES